MSTDRTEGIVYHHPDEFCHQVDIDHHRWVLKFVAVTAALMSLPLALIWLAPAANAGDARLAERRATIIVTNARPPTVVMADAFALTPSSRTN